MKTEHYTKKRRAEFILSNAINEKDYQKAKTLVQKMGLALDKILHYSSKIKLKK